MKLGKEALTAIVLIVQQGILNRTDISDELRKLELVLDKNDSEVLVVKKTE